MPAKPSDASDIPAPDIAGALLAWYDAHARDLPWRVQPGGPAPDPYRVWLSEVMLQQTTVAAVTPRFVVWTERWPDFASLAAASDADVMAAWAGLGYYARARNLLATARAVVADGIPTSEAGWRAMPGVGDYTAAAIAAIAFDEPSVVVDANVERVVAHLFAIDTPLPGGKRAIRTVAAQITPPKRPGDFAQAMMDLGATVCIPRTPRCPACPLAQTCAGLATGRPERFPVRAAKRARPTRHGTVFWLEQDGRVWLVRRPAKGLLGGMRALPTGPWLEGTPGLAEPPLATAWEALTRTVAHGFTHFELQLALASARAAAHETPTAAGEWWPIERLGEAGLPTVFARCATVFLED